jgi:hypothetical protein
MMSLRFRGGERLQRGRGIGGLLRLAKSIFSPVVKSIGSTALKVAKSKAGKAALGLITDQAISSVGNVASDLSKGKNLKSSVRNELESVKQKAIDRFQHLTKQQRQHRASSAKFKRNKVNHVEKSYDQQIAEIVQRLDDLRDKYQKGNGACLF